MARSLTGITVLLVLTVSAPVAQATFPGSNGKLAFYSERAAGNGIYVVQPDGSGATFLASGNQPSWSPDGSKIAFVRAGDLWVMNANGTGQLQLTSDGPYAGLSWTPNGSFITFRPVSCSGCTPPVFAISPQGGNYAVLDPPWPDWVFDNSDRTYGFGLSPGDVWTVNGDTDTVFTSPPSQGSCCPTVIATGIPGRTAVFSPDGTKLAYLQDNEIHTMNEAGGERVQLTSDGFLKANLAWQPVPPVPPPAPGYPRPKGATPVRVSLVPAYRQCTSPNLTHGAPLAFGSCSSPRQASDDLTVGTPDANGLPADAMGYVTLETVPDNPSTQADETDVRIRADVTGVRCAAALSTCTAGVLSAYTGSLQVSFDLRMTDRYNGGLGTDPATADVPASQLPLRATVPCLASGPAGAGSTCSVSTSADAIAPRAAKAGRRAVWQLGAVQVFDGGADGDVTTAGNQLFMTQGLFVP